MHADPLEAGPRLSPLTLIIFLRPWLYGLFCNMYFVFAVLNIISDFVFQLYTFVT
jgi:hypothetical protein